MWYVLQVRAGEELAVKDALREQGLTAIVPREDRTIRRGGEWTTQEYLLLPGYVVVQADYTADNYYLVRRVLGVLRWLGTEANDGAPIPLTYQETAWVRMLEDGGQPIQASTARLREDGQLEILSGPLLALAPHVVKYDKRSRRATVEITVAGETQRITLSLTIT